MNIDNLQKLIELAKMIDGETPAPKSVSTSLNTDDAGEKVIVRCRDAGVHFGEMIGYQGRVVHLCNSRRMWYWKAAKGHTLNACAVHGISSESKIPAQVAKILLLDACEIIPCTDEAAKSIAEANEYKN